VTAPANNVWRRRDELGNGIQVSSEYSSLQFSYWDGSPTLASTLAFSA
jgi:hypothetical protein